MPNFPHPHLVVAVGGDFVSNKLQDTWSCSLRLANRAGVTSTQLDQANALGVGEELAELFQAFWGRPETYAATDTFIRWVKWNAVGRDGRYLSNTDTNLIEQLNRAGTTTRTMPYQVATATTYRTDARRGLAASGRNFWPVNIPFNGGNGGIPVAGAQNLATSTAQLLDSINAFIEPLTGLYVAVVSGEREGAIRRVTSVDVGNRHDIQRRRDNALDEARQVVELATA